MGRKRLIKKPVLSSPSAMEAADKQKRLWEKYHGEVPSAVEGDNQPTRIFKIYAKDKATKGFKRKRGKAGSPDSSTETNQQELDERTKALDATKGMHVYRDQKWFGGLSSFDNYSDEAFS